MRSEDPRSERGHGLPLAGAKSLIRCDRLPWLRHILDWPNHCALRRQFDGVSGPGAAGPFGR